MKNGNNTMELLSQNEVKALNYLRNKKATRYYEVGYMMEDCDVFEHLMPLNDEQLAEFKAIVAECKAQDLELQYYFDDERLLPEHLRLEKPGYYEVPFSANLDKAYLRLDIRMAVFYGGIDKQPEVVDTAIITPMDEYASLLAWQLGNRRGGYNDLNYYCPELYKSVEERIRCRFADLDMVAPIATPTFAVELTGLRNDALELVGEPEVMSEIYYLGNMSITEHIVVSIEERKLAFSYESMRGEEHQGRYTIKDVDAIQLQLTLGVDNYRGIVEELKLRFGSHSGYEEFREMLLSNNIEFEEESE